MAETVMERLWTRLHATFPERQIYIRSDGRVQFFTFGPSLQATLAGLCLIFLAWVAFASVNVIFKDRIIAAKDHHYQQMQSTYENRLAHLQVSYDELNGALVSAEDTFKATADELEAKQSTVANLLGQKELVDRSMASLRAKPLPEGMPDPKPARVAAAKPAPPPAAASDSDMIPSADPGAGSEIGVMPGALQPQPRTAKPTKASFLDGLYDGIYSRLAAFFTDSKPKPTPPNVANLPAFRALAAQTARVRRMSRSEDKLMVATNTAVVDTIHDLDRTLHQVGIKPSRLAQPTDAEGVGGPDVPISALRLQGIDDLGFTRAFALASAHVKQLDSLFAAFRHVPLTTPVHGDRYELTSDFGPRIDPFTHRLGFHPGLDFGGPWGSIIHATAPGRVAFAGRLGGYGNMVEIDQGYGIRTRYGHLSSILVKVGAKVKRGSPIGRLGSTGRSTGPHVHYEVWVGNTVRDPSKFIEAGRHVLQ